MEAREHIGELEQTSIGRSMKQENIRPIRNPGSIAMLIEALERETPEVHVVTLAMLDAGLRQGEACALRGLGLEELKESFPEAPREPHASLPRCLSAAFRAAP
jgi:hypothetical protein